MTREIRKILVANRGEIALRVLRTCREMGLGTVAVYSEADRTSPHVQAADEAVAIGPAPSRESYLRIDRILEAASATGADAVHPGYGFLSENPLFAQAVSDAGLVFIGPPAGAIRAMGDKTAARALAARAGVPTVPGTPGALSGAAEAIDFCARYGYPVLVKAAAGGGGKGMRIVREARELEGALRAAASEARSAFGDERLFLERYIEEPRHVEMQIVADAHGNAVHLGERECSIQRRHQKVIEESPSVVVDEAMRGRMGETALSVARACGYVNAGTVEFLVDRDRNFYFLEMNTRLQVEHPVTELRTGLDLVALQIRIAGGERLPLAQEEVRFNGHAIECRICAEDPENNFLPSTGRIIHLRTPAGPGIRDDRGINEGGEISVFYDPMIAKLIAWDPSRESARLRLIRALREYEVLGVKTNIPLCLFVLSHALFRSGDISTHFIETHWKPDGIHPGGDGEAEAAAAVCALIAAGRATGGGGLPERRGGGWRDRRKDFLEGA
ncbi:MAG TPA: acetyl-CoA carboxylase biotin carboxylase subunit [Bacteroidota bacterium]|nr:acetyl-CoA carboxylase biotin carboxylase subunit [Bacteroidota bacterium]